MSGRNTLMKRRVVVELTVPESMPARTLVTAVRDALFPGASPYSGETDRKPCDALKGTGVMNVVTKDAGRWLAGRDRKARAEGEAKTGSIADLVHQRLTKESRADMATAFENLAYQLQMDGCGNQIVSRDDVVQALEKTAAQLKPKGKS